jgi:hypothetical protein
MANYKGLAVGAYGGVVYGGLQLLGLASDYITTAPTTGLRKGDLIVVWSSATHPVLGMCVSGATQLVQYAYGFNADTLVHRWRLYGDAVYEKHDVLS